MLTNSRLLLPDSCRATLTVPTVPADGRNACPGSADQGNQHGGTTGTD